MEERITEKQFGIDLFTWDGWDDLGEQELYFYHVEFPFESMKKYNGLGLSKTFEGKIEIYDDEGIEVVWSGYAIDIPEFVAIMKERYGI